MTDREIFQKNLKNFIEESGCKQIDIANFVGVSDKTVSAWINGRGYPRADVMEKLSVFFGVRLSDLVDEKTEDEEEALLLKMFRTLPSVGKSKLLERAQELCVLYGEKSGNVSGQRVG